MERPLIFLAMKYYYEKDLNKKQHYGEVYECDAPLYNYCTLFKEGCKGLAVIQQYEVMKMTGWTSVEECIVDDLYLNENFKQVFDELAKEPDNKGVYPHIPLRSLMNRLKMKPLKREFWETYFA